MNDQDDLDSSWQQEDLLAFLRDVDDQIASTTPPSDTHEPSRDSPVDHPTEVSSRQSSEDNPQTRPSLLVRGQPLSSLLAEKYPEIPASSYTKVPGRQTFFLGLSFS